MRFAITTLVWTLVIGSIAEFEGQHCRAQTNVESATPKDEAARLAFFEAKIRPVLIASCLDCHSVETEASGELVLDSRDGWLRGGSSGPAIEPGNADASRLYAAITYDNPQLQMPPDGPLSKDVVKDFKAWIDAGTFDPRSATPMVEAANSSALSVDRAQEHWAYRELHEPQFASAGNGALGAAVASSDGSSSIDCWIESSLVDAGLSANPPASATVLVRRLFFDLTGLPPTPQQLQQFLTASDQEAAYRQLVDELLASPRFGEVMARRWMDVVRYADSITLRGFVLPNAWRYRDYLIESFNDDKSFADMIVDQVAGDLLVADDIYRRQQQLVATAFWTLGNTNLEEQDKSQLEMDFIDEQLDVMGKAFLGQTIGCARCHDHKFDPIPTSDYYALAGILRSAVAMEHENVSKWIEQPLPLTSEKEEHFKSMQLRRDELESEISQLKQSIDGEPNSNAKFIAVSTLAGTVVDDPQAALVGDWVSSNSVAPMVGKNYLHDANTGKGAKSATFEPMGLEPGLYQVRMSYSAGDNRASNLTVRVFSADGEKSILVDQRKPPANGGAWFSLGDFRFEENGQAFVLVSNADTDGHVIVDAVQFLRVEPTGVAVGTGAPAIEANAQFHLPSTAASERKEQLKSLEAELKDIDGELAKRPRFMTVIEREPPRDIPIHIRGNVHNLGAIVPRGFLTALTHAPAQLKPNLPGRLELARWLSDDSNPLTARVYANRVWSWLLGQGIVASVDNFGTTGTPPTHPELLDELATTLIRDNWSTKSLVRKIVLTDAYRRASNASSDETTADIDPQNRLLWRGQVRRLGAEALRDTMLRISGELDVAMGGSLIPIDASSDYEFKTSATRLSVYHPVFRNSLPPLFEAFDFADPSTTVGSRARSTVATQSLALMNHPWIRQRALATAERMGKLMPGATSAELMQAMSLQCLGRAASVQELQIAESILGPSDHETAEQRLANLVHLIFASLDFRYLE